jgi:hypothetical protein
MCTPLPEEINRYSEELAGRLFQEPRPLSMEHACRSSGPSARLVATVPGVRLIKFGKVLIEDPFLNK